MNKEFYKSEVNTLQNLINKFTNAQSNVEEKTTPQTTSRDFTIVGILLFLLIIGAVWYLTYWLLH